MSTDTAQLPAKFAALEPFVAAWSIEGANNRARRRLTSTAEERAAFFDAAKDLVVPALDYLDRKPLAELDEQEQRLMNLLLSVCHVSLAVEIQRDAESQHAQGAQHLRITRATADSPR
ncbi:MAG: hypothetical protein ABW110_11415 [Steroidobacteraceae bacterium]